MFNRIRSSRFHALPLLAPLLGGGLLAAVVGGSPSALAGNASWVGEDVSQDEINSYIDHSVSNSTLRRFARDISAIVIQTEGDATSTTGIVAGNNVSVSSSHSPQEIYHMRDVTMTINGHEVRTVTDAYSMEYVEDSNNLQITVDGQVVYNASVGSATEEDLLRLAGALGLTVVSIEEVVQRDTARAATSVLFRILNSRVNFAIANLGARARADKKDKTAELTPGIQHFQDGGTYGMSAGDAVARYGVWTNLSHTFLGNDGATSPFSGRMWTSAVGADAVFQDTFLVGMAASYEFMDLETRYNSGMHGAHGWTIAPYAGLSLMDGRLVFDALFSYSQLDNSRVWNRTGTRISGSYDGDRISAATNVTYNYELPKLVDFLGVKRDVILSPGIGATYAHEVSDSYRDSNGTTNSSKETYIGDLKLGFRAGLASDSTEFYTSHYYLYDLVPMFADGLRTGEVDRDAIQSAIGVTFREGNGLSFTFEVDHLFAREDTRETTVLADIRYNF